MPRNTRPAQDRNGATTMTQQIPVVTIAEMDHLFSGVAEYLAAIPATSSTHNVALVVLQPATILGRELALWTGEDEEHIDATIKDIMTDDACPVIIKITPMSVAVQWLSRWSSQGAVELRSAGTECRQTRHIPVLTVVGEGYGVQLLRLSNTVASDGSHQHIGGSST